MSAFALVVYVAGCMLCCGSARAQDFFPPGQRAELSEVVNLDEVGSESRNRLEQLAAFVNDRRWEEALDALANIAEHDGAKLIKVGTFRYQAIREYCQGRLAQLPAEALTIYRRRTDPAARKAFETAYAARDANALRSLLETSFCTSYGDDAADTLAQLALESGDYSTARSLWDRLRPGRDHSSGLATYPRLGLAVEELPADEVRRADIPAADVEARLVLTSILEDADGPSSAPTSEADAETSSSRAAAALDRFRNAYPEAKGTLRGQSGRYVELLARMLEESQSWPARRISDDWPTFAGSPEREKIAAYTIDPGAVRWRVPLPNTPAGDNIVRRNFLHIRQDLAEEYERPLSYFPVVVDGVILLPAYVAKMGFEQLSAYSLRDGKLLWQVPAEGATTNLLGRPPRYVAKSATIGVPRFSLTVHGRKIFARLGSSVTDWPVNDPTVREPSYLACLDRLSQGKILWTHIAGARSQRPDDREVEEKGWSFEGAPLCDGPNVYVAMRRNEVKPQAYVACLDAESGQMRWKTFVAAAESPARGSIDERSYGLLTLHGDTLYYNTNLGAVASISTRRGQVNWVSIYPRAKLEADSVGKHFARDLNPCIFDRGRIYAAPADCEHILALDAASGETLWRTRHSVDDAVQLLGVCGRFLIATGERVYWIDTEHEGLVAHQWPVSGNAGGFGRGVLAGDEILWPTLDKIYRLPQQPGSGRLGVELPRQPIRLAGRDGDRPVPSGNLLVTGKLLLIATGNVRNGNELIAIGEEPRGNPTAQVNSK